MHEYHLYNIRSWVEHFVISFNEVTKHYKVKLADAIDMHQRIQISYTLQVR